MLVRHDQCTEMQAVGKRIQVGAFQEQGAGKVNGLSRSGETQGVAEGYQSMGACLGAAPC